MKIIVKNPKNLPLGTLKSLQKCFRWIPELDLVGLDHVVVDQKITDLSRVRIREQWKCVTDPITIRAVYSGRNGDSPAFITFFLDSMFLPFEIMFRFPPITTLNFSHIVAHEVGHHLVATRGYVFEPGEKYRSIEFEEEMANRYAFGVVQRMKERWHYRLADSSLKFLSKMHFEDGRQKWKRDDYAAAATAWYKAWLLDLDNEKASDLYWEAKKRSESTGEVRL